MQGWVRERQHGWAAHFHLHSTTRFPKCCAPICSGCTPSCRAFTGNWRAPIEFSAFHFHPCNVSLLLQSRIMGLSCSLAMSCRSMHCVCCLWQTLDALRETIAHTSYQTPLCVMAFRDDGNHAAAACPHSIDHWKLEPCASGKGFGCRPRKGNNWCYYHRQR